MNYVYMCMCRLNDDSDGEDSVSVHREPVHHRNMLVWRNHWLPTSARPHNIEDRNNNDDNNIPVIGLYSSFVIQMAQIIAQCFVCLNFIKYNQFSKLFYCQNREKMCNNITKHTTTSVT